MTVIQKLELTSFGRFTNEIIELKDGINSFVHHNEWGKSTVVDFIIYMLYGHKRTKKTELDENRTRRYLPWNGDNYIAGAMELECDGKLYRIERRTTAAGTNKLKVLDASGSELAITEPGKQLVGIDGETFVRTFLVRQTDIRFDGTAAIETALRNLVTTGDEDVSFDGAMQTVSEKQSKIRSLRIKTGRLYELPRLITNAELDRAALQRKKTDMSDTLSRIPELDRALAEAEAQHHALLQKEAAAVGNVAAQKLQKLQEVEREMADISEKMQSDNTPLSSLEEAYITETFAEQSALLLAKKQAEDSIADINIQLEKLYAECPEYDLLSDNEEEAKSLIDAKPRPNTAIAIVGFIIALLCTILAFSLSTAFLAGTAIGALVALIGLCVMRVIVTVPQKFDMSQEELKTAYGKYRVSKKEAQRLNMMLEVQREALGAVLKKLDDNKSSLDKIYTAYGIDGPEALAVKSAEAKNAEILKESLSRLEKLRDEILDGADAELVFEQAKLADGSELTPAHLNALVTDIAFKKNSILRELSSLESTRIEAQKLNDDILALDSEISALSLEKTELEYKNDVYDITREALTQAYEKINNTYSPILAKKIVPILSVMTDGRYSEVTVDKAFNIRVKAMGEYHELGYFSRGTVDAVYFSVRVAMADILSEGAPLILDDPFWSLDDARLKNADGLLKEISKTRQILLFAAR